MHRNLALSITFIILVLSVHPSVLAQKIFTDVTKESGLRNIMKMDSAPIWGDYDGDGALDLFVPYSQWGWWAAGKSVLCLNNGDGTFTDVTAKAGLDDLNGACAHSGFLDYDNDGKLDLYAYNPTWEPFVNQLFLYHNRGNGTFDDVTKDCGIDPGPWFSWSSGFLDYDNDGYLDIYIGSTGTDILYKNNKDGTFTDVTMEAGLDDLNDDGCNLAFGDYDNDGDMDIYVANGIAGPGPAVLYQNQGDGTFKNVTDKAGLKEGSSKHSALFFDHDNDGDLDLIVVGGVSSLRFYSNNGDGTFKNITWNTKLRGGSCERLAVGDYDNDGYIDVYFMPWGELRALYRNNGDGTFKDVTLDAGVRGAGARSGGCTFADYDNDGNLDLFEGNNGGWSFLYRNEGNDNNWLHIKAIGSVGEIPVNIKRTNKDGVGARIIVQSGNLSMIREINPGCTRGYTPLIAYFGLGQNVVAEKVEVRWPSGQVTTLTDVPANQMIVVKEGADGYEMLHQGEGFKPKSVEPQEKLTTTWGNLKRNQLYQNYPNPSNPETWIPYQLENNARVKITIHDLSGQLIRSLDLGYRLSGSYLSKDKAAYWDGRNEAGEEVASGLYFYTIQAGGLTATKKMVIAR